MNSLLRSMMGVAAMVLACAVAAAPVKATDKPAAFRTVTWDDLMPKDWDPLKDFRDKDVAQIGEGSANELAMMREMRKVWDNAPLRSELDGAGVRLPGYVVPLESESGKIREFLLVPYFGACIHSPPPPANQIVHVVLSTRQALHTMDAVWVSGTLKTQRQDSPMGVSGYAMKGVSVEPYTRGSK
jgi:hypothetical protein